MLLPLPTDRRPLAWVLILVVPLLGWLLWHQQALTIDPTNQALKAPATREAALVTRLQESFGGESALVLAFCGRIDGKFGPVEQTALRELRDELRELPTVRSVQPLVQPEPDLGLLVVEPRDLTACPDLITLAQLRCPPTLQVLATGQPLIEQAIAAGVDRDRTHMVPAIALLLFLLALVLYRNVSHALAILLPSALAIVATGGLLQLLGHRLDPVLVLLDPVLLTVGVATSVHHLGAFRRHRQRGSSPSSAARRAVHDLRWPLLLTTGTTMLGFWSLSLNAIPAVAAFGTFAALGIGVVHLLVALLLPRWLTAFPGPTPRPTTATVAIAARYTEWLRRRRRAIVGTAALATAIGAAGWLQLDVDNDPIAVLPATDQTRATHAELCNRLGGADTFGILIDRGSALQQPERLLPFATMVLAHAPVAGTAGPLRRATDGTLLLPMRLQSSGSHARRELFAFVDDSAQALGWSGVHAAGLAVQIAADSDRLVRGQMYGMLFTLTGIGLGLLVALRSLRLALLGLLPTVLPCVLVYGGLGMFGKPLSVANAMLGSCMLGLIVDNAIHLLHRYRRAHGGAREKLRRALGEVGAPMLLSSCVLAGGFATGLLGGMTTTVEFGGLAATTIALACVATLLVLPALLLLRRADEPSAAAGLPARTTGPAPATTVLVPSPRRPQTAIARLPS